MSTESVRIDCTTLGRIRKLAKDERRTFAEMMRILLEEAFRVHPTEQK